MRTSMFVIVTFFICVLVSCDDVTTKYSNWSNLLASNQSSRDWLPNFLFIEKSYERNVFNIIEKHNLDTNEVWGKLQFIKDITPDLSKWKKEVTCINLISEKNYKRLKKFGLKVDEELSIYTYNDDIFHWTILIDELGKKMFFLGVYNKLAYKE